MIIISLYIEAQKDKTRYCVYRFLDKNDKILYVGKSKQLKMRIFNHLRGRTHLPNECISQIDRIEFVEFYYECDMNIFELYCIGYFNPPYNKDSNSSVGLIKIEIPAMWNILDMETFNEINIQDTIKSSKTFSFNREAFLNNDLTDFLNSHCNQKLSDADIEKLQKICNLPNFDIDAINDYIGYNNNKVELINVNNEIKLRQLKKGRNNYGTICSKKMRDIMYLCYRVSIDGKQHSFYGKTKDELANKIYDYSLVIKPK